MNKLWELRIHGPKSEPRMIPFKTKSAAEQSALAWLAGHRYDRVTFYSRRTRKETAPRTYDELRWPVPKTAPRSSSELLDNELMRMGLSRKQARAARKSMFAWWADYLWGRGYTQMPLGTLTLKPKKSRPAAPARRHLLSHPPTGPRKPRSQRMIRFRPDPNLFDHPPAERISFRQIAAQKASQQLPRIDPSVGANYQSRLLRNR